MILLQPTGKIRADEGFLALGKGTVNVEPVTLVELMINLDTWVLKYMYSYLMLLCIYTTIHCTLITLVPN